MRSFVHTASPSRVLFGAGTVRQARGEAERLGASRVLLLSDGSPALRKDTERLREDLGDLVAAEFDGAAVHTPVEVTERALELLRDRGVDCLVAIGRGSTTGGRPDHRLHPAHRPDTRRPAGGRRVAPARVHLPHRASRALTPRSPDEFRVPTETA